MKLEARALSDGLREFNLAFRKEALQSLTAIQALKIEELRAKLGFHSVPPSSFNPQREIQKLYNDVQALSRDRKTPAGYIDEVIAYIQSQDFDFVMFDLHLVLRSYNQLLGAQSLYVFFHEIAKEDQRYPVFSVEVEIHDGDRAVVIETARNVIMLNTPAINNFEFDTVLTTPRACRFEDGGHTIPVMERFLQAKYNVTENFLLANHFRPLVKEKLPTVSYRIGLQAVREENRRILDYSELITSIDQGAGRKFSEMVSRYVDGNVVNTSEEIQDTYIKTYPWKSVERIVPKTMTVPLSLNEAQKKILIAAEKGKNQIIVVDGPPGTGKSYAITAIVYLANQLGKSVVVTSHKKQALDVIDQALTEQFKKLHPRSKPSVLRLEKSRGPAGLNSLQNTLSSPVINAARSRSQQINKEAVAKDRESLYTQIENTNSLFWDTAQGQNEVAQNVLEWNRELEALLGHIPEDPEEIPARLTEGTVLDTERIQRLSTRLQNAALSISLDALKAIFKDQEELPGILAKCDQLNRISGSFQDDVLDKVSSVPPELSAFRKLVSELSQCLGSDIPLREMDMESLNPESFEDFNDSLITSY
ncbi:MAG: AAA family ATPase, partial [Proteobacteria bacterium]|nr:AAA family ATPase [Pseudomonadota bacterium]